MFYEALAESACGDCPHYMEFDIERELEPRAVCLYGKRIRQFPEVGKCKKWEKVKSRKGGCSVWCG